MLKIHHLNNSRSQKTVWLLEELALPYEIVAYQRDPQTLMGPPALKALHPLGQAPVLEDDGHLLGESGAIAQYLLTRYGNGRLVPDAAHAGYLRYIEMLYFAVSAGMLPIMLKVYGRAFGLSDSPFDDAANVQLDRALAYIEAQLGDGPWLLGDLFTAADIQLSFVPELARAVASTAAYPKIEAWLTRLHARPGFKASIARGGAYEFAG